MNEHEAQRIAAAANAMRPDWPTASVLTMIKRSLMERPRRDVAVALAWIACESNTASPARVLEQGPWWKAAGTEGSATQREPYDRGGTCSTCSLPHEKCRRVWGDDHPYVSVAEYARAVNRDPERIRQIMQAVKGEGLSMREPSTTKHAEVTERDHSECEGAITEAIESGQPGLADYLATRCDQMHGDQTIESGAA